MSGSILRSWWEPLSFSDLAALNRAVTLLNAEVVVKNVATRVIWSDVETSAFDVGPVSDTGCVS